MPQDNGVVAMYSSVVPRERLWEMDPVRQQAARARALPRSQKFGSFAIKNAGGRPWGHYGTFTRIGAELPVSAAQINYTRGPI